MREEKANIRHKRFKNELRAYHDTINRRNRYALPKIAGKLNVFEAMDEIENERETEKSKMEIDRKIPNTDLCVLVRDGKYAIGDSDGKPLTEFDYGFVEDVVGEKHKMIKLYLAEDPEPRYFDVESKIVTECMDGGIGVSNLSGVFNANGGMHHEIEYDSVKKDLTIPYLSGYRIKDMRNGKLLHKGVTRKKRR